MRQIDLVLAYAHMRNIISLRPETQTHVSIYTRETVIISSRFGSCNKRNNAECDTGTSITFRLSVFVVLVHVCACSVTSETVFKSANE